MRKETMYRILGETAQTGEDALARHDKQKEHAEKLSAHADSLTQAARKSNTYDDHVAAIHAHQKAEKAHWNAAFQGDALGRYGKDGKDVLRHVDKANYHKHHIEKHDMAALSKRPEMPAWTVS